MASYLAVTLDPLHIGAGGYRLGRVDNTIVRDAGSGLPKVPGSSLAGVIRCYAGWCLEEDEKDTAKKKEEEFFGVAADGKDKKNSHIGLLRFYDGHIVAFPVRTMSGPVWVTCPSVLAMHDIKAPSFPNEETLLVYFDPMTPKGEDPHLNLGWLYMPCKRVEGSIGLSLGEAASLFSRFVIAPDWLFSEIVNSNLEVRTSVSINSETGAAETGALFTYEAIPSATLLSFDIEIDTYRCKDTDTVTYIRKILQRSMRMCASFGLGGMNTRGFGRVRFLEDK